MLQQALASGTAATRDAIMRSLSTMRDERATPLFAYILRHVDHRGTLERRLSPRDRVARRAPRSRSRRPADRSALQRRVVGAAADEDACARRRSGAGAHRHAGRVRRARRSRPQPSARCPRDRARSRGRDAPSPGVARPGDEHDRAAFSARRRTAPALRGGAPLGAAVLERPSDHRAATSSRSPPPCSCSTASSARS